MKHTFIFLCLAFTALFFSCKTADSQVLQKFDQTSSKNTEQIQFSNTDFRQGMDVESYIDIFKLNEDEYLNIHFNTVKPLVSYLRELGPSVDDETLVSNGNYQFSFIVDGEEVYVQDLHPGAGSAESKMTKLENFVTLLYPERLDFWGWYLWLRFMKIEGGEDALANGKHTLRIEIRSYLRMEETRVSDIIASGELPVLVKERAYDPSLREIQEIPKGSGWTISKDNYDRELIREMNKSIAQEKFIDINGIVVIKNNQLLIEEYFNESDRESLHNPRSVGKTIASTMLGFAIDEGHLSGIDQTLSEFYEIDSFDNYDPLKENISIKSLLTMSSNFLGNDDDYNSPGNEGNMYPTEDWVKFTLDLPVNKNKVLGMDFEYFTAGIVVLGDIIHKSVPGGLVSYTDEKLFKPLGITKRNWQFTPQNVGNTAGGLQLRALDFAKWGQFYKNGGSWDGKQLVSKHWIDQSLAAQVNQDHIENGTYGYLFWNNSYEVNGKEYTFSSCSGNGGNKIYVFKDIPYVIVITASAYGMPYGHSQVDKLMEKYILPAVLSD